MPILIKYSLSSREGSVNLTENKLQHYLIDYDDSNNVYTIEKESFI